jgi:hypothetical protein
VLAPQRAGRDPKPPVADGGYWDLRYDLENCNARTYWDLRYLVPRKEKSLHLPWGISRAYSMLPTSTNLDPFGRVTSTLCGFQGKNDGG